MKIENILITNAASHTATNPQGEILLSSGTPDNISTTAGNGFEIRKAGATTFSGVGIHGAGVIGLGLGDTLRAKGSGSYNTTWNVAPGKTNRSS